MADTLLDVLNLELNPQATDASDPVVVNYLNRLCTLSITDLTSTEVEAITHDSHSLSRSLQALSRRSFKSISASVDALKNVHEPLSSSALRAGALQSHIPALENASDSFAAKYSKSAENEVLARRKRALRLAENVDRISDILDMPTLLASTINATSGTNSLAGAGMISSTNANYASALDLHSHVRRLQKLYPDSSLVDSIVTQSNEAIRDMTTSIINALRSQSLKLAGAMRLIGLLRRVAPELDDSPGSNRATNVGSQEGALGSMFLLCRLDNLSAMLEALEPLRELADQERTQNSTAKVTDKNAWSIGQQSERYLKSYIEIFREQCFAIVSMYNSIFPSSLQGPVGETKASSRDDGLREITRGMKMESGISEAEVIATVQTEIPSALATFSLHVVEMLLSTLRQYMPGVKDRNSRYSLLTQVLYCASSLGRLGGDFGILISTLYDEGEDTLVDVAADGFPQQDAEWMQVMKKHRAQASRLDILASGAGASKASK